MDRTCAEAERLANSTGFYLIIIVKALLCGLGITATAICLKTQGIRWLVHPNGKILYVFHTIWAIEVPLTFLGLYVFELIRLSRDYENPCEYTIPATVGVILRGLPSLGVGLQSFTMCAMSIERAVSTAIPSKYEKIKRPYLGYLLALTPIILAPIEMMVMIVGPVNWDEVLIAPTMRTSGNARSYQNHIYIHTSVEIVTISLFFVSLAVNWWQFRHALGKPLSWRYQVKENRKIILSLLPGFCTHFALNMILVLSIQVYYWMTKVYDKTSSVIVIEASSHVQLYSLIMPIIIAIRLRRKRRIVVNGHLDASSYYTQMNQRARVDYYFYEEREECIELEYFSDYSNQKNKEIFPKNPPMNSTCLEAKALSDSVGFIFILGIKAALCVLGIFATLYSLKTSGVRWLVHANAKVIYAFHIFWTIEVPAGYAIIYIYEIIRLSAHHENPCDYTIRAAVGVPLRSIPVIGIAIQSLTMCSFAIERAVSTLWPTKYEKVDNSRLGMLMGVLSTVIGFLEMFFLIILPIDPDEPQLVTAIRTKTNATTYTNMMMLFALSEIITVSTFIITLFVNMHLCKKHQFKEINWKYQIAENSKIIRSLLPCFCTHSLLNLSTIVLTALYNVIFPQYDKVTMAIWVEFVSHIQMYSLILPIVIAFRLRKCRNTVVNNHRNSDAYFAQMTEYFNGNMTRTPSSRML